MPTKIAKKIRSIREKSNLSQKRFGVKLGISGKTISSYENGRSIPPMKMLEKIAEVYRTSFVSISNQNKRRIKTSLSSLEKQILRIKELLNDEMLSF